MLIRPSPPFEIRYPKVGCVIKLVLQKIMVKEGINVNWMEISKVYEKMIKKPLDKKKRLC